MSLFGRLRASCPERWRDYVEHRFVRELGEGTLPLPVFQSYLVQDYLFLIQFARAKALAAYKARTIADIREGSTALEAILAETRLHVGLAERWGIGEAELESAQEAPTTVAYTRYVLDGGLAGDLLELDVALAPCVIGYAEIGTRLAPMLKGRPDHPYRDWIAEYSSAEFARAADAAKHQLDRLAERSLTERRFAELAKVFRTATVLEAAFWQQAYEALPSDV